MTALLALAWPLTVALTYLLGRRHGVALARVRYADERARGRQHAWTGVCRGRRGAAVKLKMYLIEIANGLPSLLGPYEQDDSRRRAYWELRDDGREVYTLDTYTGGEARVGRYIRDDER